jgi:hypothetical protein
VEILKRFYFADSSTGCSPAASTMPAGLGQQHPLIETLRGNPVVFVQRVPPKSAAWLLLQGLSYRHVRMSRYTVSLWGINFFLYFCNSEQNQASKNLSVAEPERGDGAAPTCLNVWKCIFLVSKAKRVGAGAASFYIAKAGFWTASKLCGSATMSNVPFTTVFLRFLYCLDALISELNF